MLIRCKLVRPEGTVVTLGKGKEAREYHFAPSDASPEDHVADVTNRDDISTLLAIKEGYEIHEAELKKPAKPTKATTPADKSKIEAKQPAPSVGGATSYDALGKPALIKLVEERTGDKPHHSTGKPKLIALLVELDKK